VWSVSVSICICLHRVWLFIHTVYTQGMDEDGVHERMVGGLLEMYWFNKSRLHKICKVMPAHVNQQLINQTWTPKKTTKWYLK